MQQRLHNGHKKRARASFKPDFIAKNVQSIDFAALHRLGIRAAFVDLDGTVVPSGTHNVNPEISAMLKKIPLKVYIATNRPKSRDLKNLVEDLNADGAGAVHPHGVLGKPTKSYFVHALKDTGYKPQEVVMIGDRYLQDIFGANRAGLYSLVVMKWDRPKNWFDRLLSGAENMYTRAIAGRYTD